MVLRDDGEYDFPIRSGQVRSKCLTCTFRASCCSARLSRAQVPADDLPVSDVHCEESPVAGNYNCIYYRKKCHMLHDGYYILLYWYDSTKPTSQWCYDVVTRATCFNHFSAEACTIKPPPSSRIAYRVSFNSETPHLLLPSWFNPWHFKTALRMFDTLSLYLQTRARNAISCLKDLIEVFSKNNKQDVLVGLHLLKIFKLF